MLITIAALYVVVPALYALSCWALALRTVRFEVEAPEAVQTEARVFARVVRDSYAQKAVAAMDMASKQTNDSARKVWVDAAWMYKRRAEQAAACC